VPILETLLTPILSAAATLVTVGIGWGQIKKGQDVTQNRITELQRTVELHVSEIARDLKEIPELYVRRDVDQQRNRLIDERSDAMKGMLQDIKGELQDLRRQKDNK
jgi:hypothetical protein